MDDSPKRKQLKYLGNSIISELYSCDACTQTLTCTHTCTEFVDSNYIKYHDRTMIFHALTPKPCSKLWQEILESTYNACFPSNASICKTGLQE